MAHIGHFTRTRDGYRGHLKTLTLDAELILIPAEQSDSENAPDYRVHVGEDDQSLEIGAGWKRTGEKAGDYVSLVIDDPAMPHPIHANLFHSTSEEGAFLLTWNRPPKRREQGKDGA
ncbi:hypothetical protein A9995_15010 [Erythrobacter sp. QSSC1-22B]|uniref:DUF736 domain-containing protein n=1 Tax=Erythrobacter sp. QSSC1-22B TaxID=1860125 RepID=UPI000805C0B3|nr:DUF736 domain-containing protein [Erythrobacter sp. QSSC1-22B]OBX17695.1 hypothetical protein A9995_15010 [Erythrobacter sp. QSSC1-22B]